MARKPSSLEIVLEMQLVCPWGTLQALRSAVLHRRESLDRLRTSQLPPYPLFWGGTSDRVCSAENIYMASYSSKSLSFFPLTSVGLRSGCYFTEILKSLQKNSVQYVFSNINVFQYPNSHTCTFWKVMKGSFYCVIHTTWRIQKPLCKHRDFYGVWVGWLRNTCSFRHPW